MKFCKDCKWEKKKKLEWFWDFAKCTRPDIQLTLDLVSGDGFETYCHTQRMSMSKCGPEGKYWEAKK